MIIFEIFFQATVKRKSIFVLHKIKKILVYSFFIKTLKKFARSVQIYQYLFMLKSSIH